MEENGSGDSAPFLKDFLVQREVIEMCICCLRETADSIDKTHKDCTIANITASSAGASSGILTILGLSLAPVTAGASLILTITGASIGAAAAVTGISASISERVINSKKSERSRQLISKCEESLNKCKKSLAMLIGCSEKDFDSEFSPVSKLANGIRSVWRIAANAKALKVAQANPALKILAKEATAAGGITRASLKGVQEVEEAFKGTALAMTKGTRVLGAVGAGLFLAVDAYFIVQDAIHLVKGGKAEEAAKIRDQANRLEEVLEKLSKLYEQPSMPPAS
ncbi:apolipoprotein L2-like [Hemicordylus capensis]|uniref:apolipoprotein L2-like n=1 Tax=Hemicordylus capensis TaxID=884348 RepID=UPI0023038982|nr:apolipoprotein L2-like [Hemicordylus capensis]